MALLDMERFPTMMSHLVETVMINVDDFSDSFLTCGTCFSGYDVNEHAAKLLPCSHTICRSCLTRILETQVQPTSVFCCPICREQINFPPGGAASFPPAFIVNQLLDLLATQRRDLVPKCRLHSNQELLFCETCDVVFCTQCRLRSPFSGGAGSTSLSSAGAAGVGNSHMCTSTTGLTEHHLSPEGAATGALSHNVISFNVAIKRCTEIMLYKMQSCVQELDIAQEAVSAELQRLGVNRDLCVESINSKFSEIIALVERRQSELLDTVQRLTNEKQRALTQQLSTIQSERDAVCIEYSSLEGRMDVRSISKAIAYLNEKLNTVATLTEPRENAFMRYQDNMTGQHHHHHHLCGSTFKVTLPPRTVQQHASVESDGSFHNSTTTTSRANETAGSSLIDIVHCLASFGRVLVSTTHPSLCTAHLPSTSDLTVNLFEKVKIQAVDYHGRPQATGGMDPVEVSFTDSLDRQVPTSLLDFGDGTYEICLRPVTVGPHYLSVNILSRPIRGSPFQLVSRRAQHRNWTLAEGADGHGLIQPFAVTYGPYPKPATAGSDTASSPDREPAGETGCPSFVYILDTGNSRLLVVDPETGQLRATLTGEVLTGQAATGITWSPDGLWVVNWRSRRVSLLNPHTDQIIKSISHRSFLEPTSICWCPLTGRVYVADNGASGIFICEPSTGLVRPFLGAGSSPTGRPLASGVGDTAGGEGPAAGEPRSWRRVTGLCCADNGDLLVATGCSIRIFSSTGKAIDCLTAPNMATVSHGNSLSPLLLPSDSVSSSYYCSATNSSGYSPSSSAAEATSIRSSVVSVGSTATLTAAAGSLRLPDPSSSSNMHQPNQQQQAQQQKQSVRGQLCGVAVASWPTSVTGASLGCCLLTSYSDRQRSGVIVWPEPAWRRHSELPHQPQPRTGTDITNNNRCAVTCWPVASPYLVETEPGFRRLAGLVALPAVGPTSEGGGAVDLVDLDRHLVVVDQGGQSVCRIRYA